MAVNMGPWRRRDMALLCLVAVSMLLWFHISQFTPSTPPRVEPVHSKLDDVQWLAEAGKYADNEPPANATLGFGRIIAVSTRTSHRRASLQLSANLTGLELSIPDQPVWRDEDIQNFKAKQKSKISRGSAMAWMGHLNALRWFLSQPYETALIIEDDIDWDIHLRYRQIPLLHRAFQDLITNPNGAPSKEKSDSAKHTGFRHVTSQSIPSDTTYWPTLDNWDILYFGHCGDFFKANKLSHFKHTTYPDPTMPAFSGLHVDTQNFLAPLPIPPKHRFIHQSQRVLCTFAYGVTRASAARILRELGHEEENHGTEAYDVRILEACRDLGWRCWSVNPELFHHVDDQASEIKIATGKPPEKPSLVRQIFDKGGGPSADDTRRARARGTPNIGCGIRGAMEKLGASTKSLRALTEAVAAAREVDGLCPISAEELDNLRAEVVEKGRNDLPIG